MRARRLLTYACSWLRADLIGHTVCRALGHADANPEVVEMQRWVVAHPAGGRAIRPAISAAPTGEL